MTIDNLIALLVDHREYNPGDTDVLAYDPDTQQDETVTGIIINGQNIRICTDDIT